MCLLYLSNFMPLAWITHFIKFNETKNKIKAGTSFLPAEVEAKFF